MKMATYERAEAIVSRIHSLRTARAVVQPPKSAGIARGSLMMCANLGDVYLSPELRDDFVRAIDARIDEAATELAELRDDEGGRA